MPGATNEQGVLQALERVHHISIFTTYPPRSPTTTQNVGIQRYVSWHALWGFSLEGAAAVALHLRL